MHESRRKFLAGAAAAGALTALRDVKAQAAPEATVSNEAIKQGKLPSMQWHSERPLTGSVPAHEHDFDVTPSDRMFVRNNLLTPVIESNLRFGGDSGVGLADAAINLGGLGADRPIGLLYDSFRRSYVFTPQVLLLNYRIAELAISRPYTNNGAGVIEIRYREIQDNGVNTNGVTDGNYSLFLLIERLP